MNRPFIIPVTTDRPIYTFGFIPFPLQQAQRWADGISATEWLGGEPSTVVRMRCEDYTPVPFTAGDMAELEALLGGGA